MRKTYQLKDIEKAVDTRSGTNTETALKKQFIWQHLAQKKIKRAIKAQLKVNSEKN